MPTLTTNAKPIRPFPDFGPELTYAESVKSATAIRRGIANVPPPEYFANMALVFIHVIRPIFRRWGKKSIPSFYRSMALNKAIGGAKNSQHLYGQAVDIDCDGLPGISNKKLLAWIRAGGVPFDQCISEFEDEDGNPQWLHLSFVSFEANRGQVLRAVKRSGRTVYLPG